MTDHIATSPSIAEITGQVIAEHAARIDELCLEALTDPERRGVLIERFTDFQSNRIECTYTLSREVPYGEIHERSRS